ncbi:50S ribosomal protein L17 [Nitrospina gracilis]|uniref:50S ribosomal protein L17 n=1 Tax=Nitrospina gracilis TaxID=35801 RepID=UPI0035302044|nr:large subunit ribosomal protein L17 [Nitrospina gracilis Nb-211]
MRHLKAGRKLGRTSAHRKALFRNLVTALIVKERIRTTLAKAKELRSHVEKTITLGKKGTLHARRRALRVVHGKEAFLKLFDTLSDRYANRNGGYTRILHVGNRRGDDAPMAIIELVDREGEQAQAAPAKEKKGKKESGGKKETGEKKAPAAKKEDKDKAPAKKKAAPKEDKAKEGEKKTAAKKSTSSKKKSDDK